MQDAVREQPGHQRGPGSRSPGVESPSLSIVIPAYNEAARIGVTLERIRDYALRTDTGCEIIVVDDGSRDATADVVRQVAAQAPAVRLLANATNRGKGYSVRQGVLAATGDVVLMCDADLSAPIEELEKLLPWLDHGCDVAIGSRDLPDSRLDPPQPLLRRWAAWAFRAIRRRVLLPELRDTQCGFKCFRREAAQAIFARQTIDGWLFDCEVRGLADRLGYRIKEVGVVWRHDPVSRVQPLREAPFALPTLLRLRHRLSKLSSAQGPR